ncbi:MAG: hypothetical protein IAG13_11525 [Deltaproteobacteria bacterium]|nr:hypothetical protein [Nannocystaceae bacterium]
MPVDPTLVGTCAVAAAGWLAVRDRRRRTRRRALEHALSCFEHVESNAADHLSPTLARMIDAARMARWALETPLRRLLAIEPALHEWPWHRRERASDYDAAITEARRALWEWLGTLRALPAAERVTLGGLGLDARPMWSLVLGPGVFERTTQVFDDGWLPAVPDTERVIAALSQALQDLQRFELTVLSLRQAPYR